MFVTIVFWFFFLCLEFFFFGHCKWSGLSANEFWFQLFFLVFVVVVNILVLVQMCIVQSFVTFPRLRHLNLQVSFPNGWKFVIFRMKRKRSSGGNSFELQIAGLVVSRCSSSLRRLVNRLLFWWCHYACLVRALVHKTDYSAFLTHVFKYPLHNGAWK